MARTTRRRFVGYGGAAATVLLAGCTGDGDDDGGPMRAALSIPSLEFTFFARMENAFNAAKEAGDIAGNSTFFDAKNQPSNQVSHVETAIENDVDFLMISAIVEDAVVSAVEDAVDAGIPVVAIDRNVASDAIATYVASDNVSLGERSTQLLIDFLQEQQSRDSYRVVQLEGTPGASVTNDRGTGYTNVIQDSDNVTSLASQTGEFATQQALSVMEDFITQYGDRIHGVFAQNDLMAIGAHRAVRDSDIGPIPITGIDGTQGWVELFSDNQYYGTIAQLPEEMVNSAIEKGKMAVNEETLEAYYKIDGLRLTQENAQNYLDEYF